MTKFIMKCGLIATFLTILVILSIQHAYQGIESIHRIDSQINLQNQGLEQEEVSFIGEKLTSADLLKKHQQLEEVKAFNFFSSLGSVLSHALGRVLDGFITVIIKIIESIF